jgi:large subunit ribosomal protein L15
MKAAEILNYSSILPEKRKKTIKRAYEFEPIKVPDGSRKNRKRIGRGTSSGTGKTSGKGQKGQKARTGYSRRAGFEGGQMPLHRRLPKRGFTNIFRTVYQVVNLETIVQMGFSGTVTPMDLKKKSLIADPENPVKILGEGELSSGLQIEADAFSESAKAKVEKAGGICKVRINPKLQMTRRPKFIKKAPAEKKAKSK